MGVPIHLATGPLEMISRELVSYGYMPLSKSDFVRGDSRVRHVTAVHHIEAMEGRGCFFFLASGVNEAFAEVATSRGFRVTFQLETFRFDSGVHLVSGDLKSLKDELKRLGYAKVGLGVSRWQRGNTILDHVSKVSELKLYASEKRTLFVDVFSTSEEMELEAREMGWEVVYNLEKLPR